MKAARNIKEMANDITSSTAIPQVEIPPALAALVVRISRGLPAAALKICPRDLARTFGAARSLRVVARPPISGAIRPNLPANRARGCVAFGR